MISYETRFAIDDLISSYSFGFDLLNWELFSSIWAEDAIFDIGGNEQVGKDVARL